VAALFMIGRWWARPAPVPRALVRVPVLAIFWVWVAASGALVTAALGSGARPGLFSPPARPRARVEPAYTFCTEVP
jgi:hypothetical protein